MKKEESALFLLRRRLERLRASAVEAGDEGDVTEEVTEFDAEGECPSKPDEGNTRPRARLGRRRTHNEQLVVSTCGVILGRATMFGSEGLNGVRVSLQQYSLLQISNQLISFTDIPSVTLSRREISASGALL